MVDGQRFIRDTDGLWRTAVTQDRASHFWKINPRIIQLNILLECMISFPQFDPDIPLLALIVNFAGDILDSCLEKTSSHYWTKWVVITESRIAQSRLQTADWPGIVSPPPPWTVQFIIFATVSCYCRMRDPVILSNLFVIMAHNTMNIYEVMM